MNESTQTAIVSDEPLLRCAVSIRDPAAYAPGVVSTDAVVLASNVVKRYGETVALDGVSLRVDTGQVIGLLGPNGAGKTTLLEILQGLRSADSGEISVLGAALDQGLGDRLQRVGVSPQSVALPRLLTPAEMFDVYGRLYDRKRPIPELLKQLGLEAVANTRFSRLSGGQQKRLALGVALLGDPDLLLLDEPTSDIDPQGRRHIWELITEARAGGHRSTLLSTHQMDEAEALCDRVVIIDHGKILAEGRPSDLVIRHAPGHALRFTSPTIAPSVELANLGTAKVEPIPGGMTVHLQVDDLNRALESIMAWRGQDKLRIDDLQIKRNTLEQVFINLTGRSLRD